MWSSGSYARRIVGLGCLLALSAVWLHVAHLLTGHVWFARYGPLLAGCLVLGFCVLVPAGYRRGWRQVVGAGALLFLLVIPEWLEGEWLAGHPLNLRTLADHGQLNAFILSVAVAAVMALEGRRVLALIRSLRTEP